MLGSQQVDVGIEHKLYSFPSSPSVCSGIYGKNQAAYQVDWLMVDKWHSHAFPDLSKRTPLRLAAAANRSECYSEHAVLTCSLLFNGWGGVVARGR